MSLGSNPSSHRQGDADLALGTEDAASDASRSGALLREATRLYDAATKVSLSSFDMFVSAGCLYDAVAAGSLFFFFVITLKPRVE